MKKELQKMLELVYATAKKENWTFKDVVAEIATAGFSNDEVGIMIKHIILNETFDIK